MSSACRWVRLVLAIISCSAFEAHAAQLTDGRLTTTFNGIECQYSPGQEELARLLAERFEKNNAMIESQESESSVAPSQEIPLSPREMRANRAIYLQRIGVHLGMENPGPLQEECYDAFLENYEMTMQLNETLRNQLSEMSIVRRFSIWDRGELVKRFESGQKIPGFSYDPITKQGRIEMGSSIETNKDKLGDVEAKREKLRRDYSFKFHSQNGSTTYSGKVSPKKKAVLTKQPASIEQEKRFAETLPVIIPAALASEAPEILAESLWTSSIAGLLDNLKSLARELPSTNPVIAGILIHETVEVGIIDHYYRGRDRRWFCDGMANYVPWRVVRDLHGEDTAKKVYDLPSQVAMHEAMRERVDLKHWPAGEDQTDSEQGTPLNQARYAFATKAVFLMNARAGEDILPKFFNQIGKTKPEKVSMKTVESAWRKVSGTKLDTILAEAVSAPKLVGAAVAK